MPLLRRQPFVKQEPPPGLKDDDEVFVCKTTKEIFIDYEKFFERTILCNSLVWTCELTGKSGLTFQEALDSEEKASKQLALIPEALQKPILFLVTLTHRTRLSDVNEDVYSFVKEHFFNGEILEVLQHGEKKKCRVIKVMPDESNTQNGKAESVNSISDDDSVICLDDPEPVSEKTLSKKNTKAADYEYVVQELKKSNIYIVKPDLMSRKWGSYTRDKSKIFLKQHCVASPTGRWIIKERYMKKFKIAEMIFSEAFEGTPPTFGVSEGKRKPYGSACSSTIDLTDEDKAIKRAKKQLKHKKKKEKQERKQIKENIKKRMKDEKMKKKKEKIKKPEVIDLDEEPNFEDMRKLSSEEKAALKEQIKADKLAARVQHLEERKKIKEEEKRKKKEERDKEREKQKEEKLKRDAYLKEWSKPRDDLECDDLKDLPVPVPVQTHIPTEMFGDAMMVLEYLSAFGSLMDIQEQFPNGISIGDLGKALVGTEVDGLLFDLIKLMLMTLFQLQVDEEDEDNEDEEDRNINLKNMPQPVEDKSFKELVKTATIASQWPQLYYSTPLRELPIDSFTITEILRLHFLSSGAKAPESSARFRYQQRGGFTSHDDAGLEFTRLEISILKKLAVNNLFDLGPGDKLKVLTALIHQLLTFAASRDFMEDSMEQLKQVSNSLRHHRLMEQRREKEEITHSYKKRLEERAKEKELENQRKEENKKRKVEQLAFEESGPPSADASKSEQSITPKDSPILDAGERHSSRQKAKFDAKNDAGFFETAIEDIEWERIGPEDRVRLKNKYYEKELELVGEIYEVQHAVMVSPIGRDRTFRRYWLFQSLPGLFVEDDEQHIPDEVYQDFLQSNKSLNDSVSKPEPAVNGIEEKSTCSDKENDSFDLSRSSLHETPVHRALSNDKNVASLLDNSIGVNGDEKTKILHSHTKISALDQISHRNGVKWSYYRFDQLDSLLDSLNPRGYREGALKIALLDIKTYLCNKMNELPVYEVNMTKTDKEDKKVKYQNVKSRKKITQGAVKNASAQEYLELNTREMLLDIEERIYVGSLGAMKVIKRDRWRDAIEQGTYDAQQLDDEPLPDLCSSPMKQNGITEDDDASSQVIKNLSRALLQIERGLDRKYLAKPLGEKEGNKKLKQKAVTKSTSKTKTNKDKKRHDDDSADEDEADDDKSDKGPQKTPLELWEESLMLSTSFSQILLHLSVLESSILWSKSSLHARCRMCRRKGDGDKMLLCDGCDRGHHMYCLKPPVKTVPKGDWYCPDCKPKDIPKTPRKRRISIFQEDEESQNEDSSEEEDSSDDDDDDDDDDSDNSSSDDSDAESTEMDTEEEEEAPTITKIKFINAGKKKSLSASDKGKHSSNSNTSLEKSSSGARASSSVSSKRKLDLEADKNDKKRNRRSLPDPVKVPVMKPSRSSLDSVKPGAKRKRDDLAEEVHEAKKPTTKSRGGQRDHVSKLCEELVHEIFDKKESWPFLTAVSKRDAPDYFDIVKKPMDLATIKNKINKFEYIRPSDILDDVRLMFRNCEQYNLPNAAEYIAGLKLSKFFEKRVKELQLLKLLEVVNSPKKASSPVKNSSASKRSTRQK